MNEGVDTGPEEPGVLLSQIKDVRRRSRAVAHGGVWFPALVLAALPLASIVLYEFAFGSRSYGAFGYPFWAGLPDTQRSPMASRVFWFVGMPLAFALIGLWYRRRANRVGVRVNWLPLAITGIGLLALVALILAFPQQRLASEPGVSWLQDNYWGGLLTPLLPVGLAIVMLGRLERSWTLVGAGLWLSAFTYQSCLYGLGQINSWQPWILSGGSGPALGGSNDGLAQPGVTLIVMTAPLVIVALVKAVAAARAARRPS